MGNGRPSIKIGFNSLISLDWAKGQFTRTPYVVWKTWFPVDFPFNQSSGKNVYYTPMIRKSLS